MNQEKIGKFIAECRKKNNMTQEELAEKIGVSRKSVSRWENGNTMPDYSILDNLCNVLNVSINEIYYGKNLKDDEYKNISEKNLRLYMYEKYRKYYLMKRSIYGFIIAVLIYIVVYLLFIK